mgnify:FL=1
MDKIILVFILSTVAAPYIAYAFLYGATMVKRLLDSEWQKGKGLDRFVRATPEDRMQGQLKVIAGQPPKPSAWLDAATPDEAEKIRQERALKEGLRPVPKTGWEAAQPEQPPVSKLP